MEAGLKPLARSENLIVERLDGEVLVYDKQTDRGHCLSREAALVWDRCDGRTPVGGLSAQLGLDADVVERALGELETCDLLDTAELPDVGSTRREVTVKMVKVGGAVAAAPLIASIAAPTPAAAQSPVEGCEALFECLTDCGFTGHGCKGTGCCCCQLPQATCDRNPAICGGVAYSLASNVKFCAPVQGGTPSVCNATICPNYTDPCVCLGSGSSLLVRCPDEFQPSTATKSARSTSSQTQTQAPAPETTAPAPETPAPAPSPEPAPSPAPAPEAPAPPPTTTTTTPPTGTP